MDDSPPPLPADRRPPPLTAERLERAALRYLERFAASTARLRRVLMARVDRSARDHGTDPAVGAAWVDGLLERYRRCGLLDDAAYAEAQATSLRRRGASARMVRERLAGSGIAADLAVTALRSVDDRHQEDAGGADADLTAARALVKRRRLGRFRPADQRAAHRNRDLATLGRAGFDYQTARQALEAGEEDGEGEDEG
jgi:regulatory protein